MDENLSIEDFTRCPSAMCERSLPVSVDYQQIGEQLFVQFYCPDCEAGSLEDDIEWYVKCPCCDKDTDSLGAVTHVSGGVNETGKIWFECTSCGVRRESYPNTKWG